MTFVSHAVGGLLALLLCANSNAAEAESSVASEFVGTTLGGTLPREFLGGLSDDDACPSGALWQIPLLFLVWSNLDAYFVLGLAFLLGLLLTGWNSVLRDWAYQAAFQNYTFLFFSR